MPRKPKRPCRHPGSFFFAEPVLSATLQVQQVTNPGDSVELQYVIVNSTRNTFSNIRVADATLGEIDAGLALEPGQAYHGFKSVTVNESTVFRLTIHAADEAGNEITVNSNEASVQTTDSIKDAAGANASQNVHIDAQALLDAWSQREGHWSAWRYETWAAYREETGDSAPMYTLPSTDEMTEAEAIRRVDEIILAEYPRANLARAVLGTVFIRPQDLQTPYWDISYRDTTVDESGAHPYLFNVHLSVTDGSHELAVRMPGWDEIVPDNKFTPILHYNSLGGKYFHADPECATVSPEYLPLEAFNKQILTETPYRKLKPCFECVLTREP